jgi:hypothetical protein
VGADQWFCRSDEEWIALAERLKLTPCPHCRVVGTLIRHGFLYGFDDGSPDEKRCAPAESFAATASCVAVAAEPSAFGWPTKSAD